MYRAYIYFVHGLSVYTIVYLTQMTTCLLTQYM